MVTLAKDVSALEVLRRCAI